MSTHAALAPPLTDEDRTKIRDMIARFDRDMLASDWPAVLAVYAEDAVLMPPNAPMIRGRTEIGRFFEAFPKLREFRQSALEIAGPRQGARRLAQTAERYLARQKSVLELRSAPRHSSSGRPNMS